MDHYQLIEGKWDHFIVEDGVIVAEIQTAGEIFEWPFVIGGRLVDLLNKGVQYDIEHPAEKDLPESVPPRQ